MAEQRLPYNIRPVEKIKSQKPLILTLLGLALAIIFLVIISLSLLSKNQSNPTLNNTGVEDVQQIAISVTPRPQEDYQVASKKYTEAIGKIVIDDALVSAFQKNPKFAAEGFPAKISAGPKVEGLDSQAAKIEVRRFLIEIATYYSDMIAQGGEVDSSLYQFIVQLIYMAKIGNSPYVSSTNKASWQVAIKQGKEVTYDLIGHAKVKQKELKEYLDTTYKRDEFKGY